MIKKITPMLDQLVGGMINRRLTLILVLLLAGQFCLAQLQRYPVQRIAKPLPSKTTENATARTKETVPLSLPFWDDFSTSYKEMYPDIVRWDSSFSVWVNDGMAVNAPTVGVATFDGLDSAGLAYEPNEILLKGYTDTLMTNPINLGETGDKPVLQSEQGSVFLSFFYQWQGNGEAPDAEDHFLIEFKSDTSGWEPVLTVRPRETFQRDVFYDTIIQVTGARFFHDAFQFRFISFGRKSGPYDGWNIDYVYLNKGRDLNDVSFPDRAAASPISSLFKPYVAIPYSHFLATKELDSATFDVQNLKDFPASTTYNASVTYQNYTDSIPVTFSKILVSSGGVKGVGGDMMPFERVKTKLQTLPDVNNPLEFDPNADFLDIKLKMEVLSNDNIDDTRFDFEPIDLRVNDTVSFTYRLRDYYAYDDGTAEYAAGLIQTGNLVAYQFELPENLGQDTLIAFDIYFPPNGVSSNQTVDFFIYPNPDSVGMPDSNNAFRIPSRPVSSKGINEFQRIVFLPALLITKKKFYIGWKEPVSGKMFVGLDVSNDTGDKIFVNTNGFWEVNDVVHGSLMIRPVFGSGVVDAQVGIEKEMLNFSVYPNPTRGSFYIGGKPDRMEILSITGQPVPFQSESDEEKTFIQLKQPPGLYLLRFTKGNLTKTHKLIVIQ